MRRLVVLIVLCLLGAGAYGLTSSNSAVAVNGTNISNSNLRSELRAFTKSLTLQCYFDALSGTSSGVNYAAGAGDASITASGAATWSNLRIQGIAVADYVKKTFGYVASAKDLKTARVSLEAELTEAATSAKYACPGSSSAALAAMTPEMRSAEIEDQAASLYLVSRLNSTIPLNSKSVETFYTSHVADYDTICVSVALVAPNAVSAFEADKAKGMSVADLAYKYSSDASRTDGGAFGCYAPSNTSYTSVRSDVQGVKLNTFSANLGMVTSNGSQYALFVAPTKVTVTPFAKAQSAVISDIQTLNTSAASSEEQNILYAAHVRLNPTYGRWGISSTSTGPSVFVPALPAQDQGLGTAAQLTTASKSKYK